MIRIGIILGSTRPNRNGEQVARWIHAMASRRGDAEFELVDLRDYPLPHLDEPLPPPIGQYQHEHTRAWAARSPRSTGSSSSPPSTTTRPPAVLKNALDYLYAEWNNKAAGFVSYGAAGGARAVEHLRLICADPADGRRAPAGHAVAADRVRELHHLQAESTTTSPAGYAADQVVAWSTALAPLRTVSAGHRGDQNLLTSP